MWVQAFSLYPPGFRPAEDYLARAARVGMKARMNGPHKDVPRRALEAHEAGESWTEEERLALSTHIEEGYLQAGRGELIDGAQARREIQAMKDAWRLSRK